MIDHIGLTVSELGTSRAFYELALAPLGYRILVEVTEDMTGGNGAYLGFGQTRPDFWIGAGQSAQSGAHIAFGAADRATVDAFHAAAVAAGGTDNGAPGPRPQYHEHYYGAFVLDPDGNNVEAVCHLAPT